MKTYCFAPFGSQRAVDDRLFFDIGGFTYRVHACAGAEVDRIKKYQTDSNGYSITALIEAKDVQEALTKARFLVEATGQRFDDPWFIQESLP